MSIITGTVRNPETSAPETDGIVELLDPIDKSNQLYKTDANADGTFAFQDVKAGSYILFSAAWGTDKRYFWEVSITVTAGANQDINLNADNAECLD